MSGVQSDNRTIRFWFEAAKYDVLPLEDRFAERGELPQLMSAQGSCVTSITGPHGGAQLSGR